MSAVDDGLQPQMGEIYAELKRLSEQMHDAGYVPDMKYMLHDVQRKRKWCFSSITIARNWLLHFGLFSTPPSTLDSRCITKHPCGRYVLTAVLQQSSLQNYLGEL
jgi:hypothetical protein